jgi:hypothetical protein
VDAVYDVLQGSDERRLKGADYFIFYTFWRVIVTPPKKIKMKTGWATPPKKKYIFRIFRKNAKENSICQKALHLCFVLSKKCCSHSIFVSSNICRSVRVVKSYISASP